MQLLTPQQIEQASNAVNNLTPAQKVWVSGYLHGLSLQATSQSGLEQFSMTAAAAPAVSQKVTVLYGSQTGNSRKIAEKLHAQLESQGKQVTLQNMLNYRSSQLKKEEHLIAVVSTHGNGEPPDEALGFFKFINSAKAPKLDHVKFSVLALGDSSYDEFCQTGFELDARLAELGATRLTDVIGCDVDYADDAASWQESVLELLKTEAPSVGDVHFGAMPLATTTESEYTEQNPFKAEVLETLVLTDEGSDKSVMHIEISLEDSGIHYAPGDIVAIQTNNAEDLVDGVIKELGLDGQTLVTIKKQTLPLQEALLTKRELTHITRKQLKDYAALIGDVELAAQAEDKGQLLTEIEAADVLDMLQLWPAKALSAQALVDLLRPLSARQYSIASSETASPEEVHVLVKQVEYEYRGRVHGGVCSTQLAGIESGDSLGVSIKPNSSFKLPENAETKVIMIGAGTGVAPFRSFLFDRDAQGIEGNTWLFFGEQRFQTDFLYQTEWQQFLKSGVLEKMSVAFSRDQAEKIYVQQRIVEQAKSVYQWLEEGAHVYVCGDMNHMAKDVHQALIDVIAQESERSAEQASEWLDQLIADKRYQRDVY
jgi:sulfite reductase (NADPH) flavoprotein alpha-component